MPPNHSLRGKLLPLLLSLPFSLSISIPQYYPITRSCSTSPPSDELRSSLADLHLREPLDTNDLWDAARIDSHIAKRQSNPTPFININTYFHIVTDAATAQPSKPNYVTPTMVQNQLTYLQNQYERPTLKIDTRKNYLLTLFLTLSYKPPDPLYQTLPHQVILTKSNAPFGITFTLISTDRTINATWASNGDDSAMKHTLRQGTYSSLNIYFQSQLQSSSSTGGISAGDILLGFCSLPSAGVTPTTPIGTYNQDGCNILSSTMPGGTTANYNLGGTTTHEVGHWFGLLHTFNDYTCSVYDFGDYVADTPQQSISTQGCPSTPQDSCPSSGAPAGYTGVTNAMFPNGNPYGPQGYSGTDLIHNFMDYSSDICYQSFTSGQAARMINLFGLYRAGN